MECRAAEQNDLDQILEMALAVHRESVYRVLSFDAGKVRTLLEAILNGGDMVFAAVVEHDGLLIGMMGGYAMQHYFSSDLVVGDYLLYVRPEHRGTTAARRLVAAYKEWAKRIGAKMVVVGVTAGIDNERAAEFYERCGFVRSGVTLKLED